ncbi:hypothetical protein KFE25_009747 [Diacronema lutheri]|uniref:Fe2OG dioxygenase domain-containing protein n=1 Tax=Diacronema lutheri TaxID=2081491 RepID=A0A8J5XL21_DIALT|nr:hypothetical protein KFE25_009747 [Diacronema lutheri]
MSGLRMRAARAMDCRCTLTSHLFAHSVSRHFDYEGEEAFRRAHAAYLRSLGPAAAAALVAELDAEARRRARLEPDARARIAAIAAGWAPARPELYALEPRWLDARFAQLAERARALTSAGAPSDALAALEPLGLRQLGGAFAPVYELPVLSAHFCAALCAELRLFQASGLPQGRPNSMNRLGLLLAELGFAPLLDELVAAYVRPLAALLFPHAGGASLDSHRAFTVQYRPGADEALAPHYDNAELTLNVCIGSAREDGGGGAGFEGGELVFGGLNGGGGAPAARLAVEHGIGRAVLHLGAHMHQALPVTHGERINLVIWCRSEAHRRAHGCPLCGRTDQLLLGAAEPADAAVGAPAAAVSDEQVAEFMRG